MELPTFGEYTATRHIWRSGGFKVTSGMMPTKVVARCPSRKSYPGLPMYNPDRAALLKLLDKESSIQGVESRKSLGSKSIYQKLAGRKWGSSHCSSICECIVTAVSSDSVKEAQDIKFGPVPLPPGWLRPRPLT
jgi:hypothetical protein